MGYGPQQIKELENTVNCSNADIVVIGTPIDLSKIIKINKPFVEVTYELQEIGKPNLEDVIVEFCQKKFIKNI